jgi:hypothetical protein
MPQLPEDLDRIRQHYQSTSSEELGRALSHGPAGYSSPAVWQLLTAIAKERGLPIPEAVPIPGAPPAPPGLLKRQPSALAGCLMAAKWIVLAVAALNLLALVVVVISNRGLNPFPSLMVSNLVVLGIAWVIIDAIRARAARSAEPRGDS